MNVIPTTIPKSFINQAENYNLPEWLAKEIFEHKVQKLSGQHTRRLALTLVKNGYAQSGSKARFIITQLWRDYTESDDSLLNTTEAVADEFLPLDGKQTHLDKAREGLEAIIGKLKTPKPPVKNKTNRAIVCSDLHAPFHSEKAIAALLAEEADEIYFLGDIIDCFSISRHRKTVEYINLRDELAQARSFVEALAAHFPNVYLLKSGNHDNRVLKAVQDVMPQILPLLVHPTDLVAAGLPNVHVISKQIKDTAPAVKHGKNYECDFLAIKGDIAFGHFENFSGGESLKKIDEWLQMWSEWLELDEMPRVIFSGHTHRLYSVFTPKGRQLVNTGCLCKAMPYQFEGHGTYSPPTIGYTAFYRDPKTGLVDLNKTEVLFVGK